MKGARRCRDPTEGLWTVVLDHAHSGHAHERCDASKSVKSAAERCGAGTEDRGVGNSV